MHCISVVGFRHVIGIISCITCYKTMRIYIYTNAYLLYKLDARPVPKTSSVLNRKNIRCWKNHLLCYSKVRHKPRIEIESFVPKKTNTNRRTEAKNSYIFQKMKVETLMISICKHQTLWPGLSWYIFAMAPNWGLELYIQYVMVYVRGVPSKY